MVLEGGTPPCRSPVAKTLSLYMPDNVKIDPQTIVDLDLKVLVKIPRATVGMVSIKSKVTANFPQLKLVSNILRKNVVLSIHQAR